MSWQPADAPTAPPCRAAWIWCSLPLREGHEERGVYIVQGAAEVAGMRFKAGPSCFSVPTTDWHCGRGGGHAAAAGWRGDGRARFIFWNFVASSRERIEQAKADWQAGRFGKIPGDEQEFIPQLEGRTTMRAEGRQVSAGSPTSLPVARPLQGQAMADRVGTSTGAA
jgi:hypothetical protein